MSNDSGLTKGQIVFLSALTSMLMFASVAILSAPEELGIPKWIGWLAGLTSPFVVILRDAYGLRAYPNPKAGESGVTT